MRSIDDIEEREKLRVLLDETIKEFVCFSRKDGWFVFIREDNDTSPASVRVYSLLANELCWRDEVLVRKNQFSPIDFYNVFPGEKNYDKMFGVLTWERE